MNVAGKKAAILVHNYFEQSEFEVPLRSLKEAGVAVTVIAADTAPLYGMHHNKMGSKFLADIQLKDARPDEYDGLVLPGGVINADILRAIPEAQQFAVAFLEEGKPLAAICHAPWLLVSADAVEGRRLTSYYTLQDDIRNAGGEWVDQEVVADHNLITSRQPDDLTAFCEAFLQLLGAVSSPAGEAQPYKTPNVPTDEIMLEEETRLKALGYDRGRDQLTHSDAREILADEDDADPDALHPSDLVSPDEQDGTQ